MDGGGREAGAVLLCEVSEGFGNRENGMGMFFLVAGTFVERGWIFWGI